MDETKILSGPVAPPANGRKADSMVILLHGYGSNGEDLMGLVPYWRDALPDTVFLGPNAPEPCPGAPGGYQWWALTDLSPASRAAGVRRAAPALDGFIDAQLAAYGVPEERVALVGFSQGTMMALHVAPRRPRTLAGVVGYSGMLADAPALAGEARSKPPVLLVHGDADPTVPFAAMRQAEDALQDLGLSVAAHAAHGLGHSIDEMGLRLGRDFLARALVQPG
jgi:phospholipase/carboxylesterase